MPGCTTSNLRALPCSCLHRQTAGGPHGSLRAHPSAGNSQHKLGTAAACAVKRIDLDARVAAAAKRAGANLMEGFEVGIQCRPAAPSGQSVTD